MRAVLIFLCIVFLCIVAAVASQQIDKLSKSSQAPAMVTAAKAAAPAAQVSSESGRTVTQDPESIITAVEYGFRAREP